MDEENFPVQCHPITIPKEEEKGRHKK